MSNYIRVHFKILKNEDLKIIIILLFVLLLFILMIIPINQNKKFEEDSKLYKKAISEMNSKLDYQTAVIQKTIDEQFNNINCVTK